VPLLISGGLEDGDPPKILVRSVLALDRAEEKLGTRLRVRIGVEEATQDRLTALRRVLESQSGECAVTLHVVIPDESETVMTISAIRGVRPDAVLRGRIDDLCGRPVTELEV
jgi:hypothetical protein